MRTTFSFWKDKIVYSDKRKKGIKSILVSFVTIIISLSIALLITCIIYKDFSLFSKIFSTFFTHPFATAPDINATISSIAIFAVAAIAFLIAMKCGLFNIGISGQMLFGGTVATIVAQHMVGVPNGLSQILIILISIISAASISTLIGFLKSSLNVNEVVSSIMLNWIIYFIATLMLARLCQVGSDGLETVALNTLSPKHNLVLEVSISGTYVSWLPLIIIAIIVISFTIVLLNFTTFGKKIINTGMSQTAAKYAGYSTKFNQVTAMLISGAIAGILGAMVYLGKADNMPVTVAAKTIPQEGFTGISVGLIAMSNSWAILPISLLFGMIDSSKVSLQTLYGVDPAVADTIFGIVVYGAAIISIFYFLVPYKWYLRIFKGKAYANNYAQYVDNINQDLDDATSIIHYLHHQNLDQNYLNSINKDSLKLRMKKFNINFSNKMNYENVRSYKQKIYASFPNLKAIRKKELMVLVEKEKNHQLKGAK